MRYFLLLVMAGLLSSCSLSRNPSTYPVAREYIPQYITLEFTLNNRYRIQHDYFTGGYDLGIGGCAYRGLETPPELQAIGKQLCGVMYEDNGRVFQRGQTHEKSPKTGKYTEWRAATSDMSNFVLGQHAVSKLGGGTDAQGNPLPLFVNNYIRFVPFCSDQIGGFEFGIRLQKSSSQTIREYIEHRKNLLNTAWKEVSSWEPECHVKRGSNDWILFKSWNRADYLADAGEDWYLSIGDGAYYYLVSFSYKSASIKNNPDQYAKGRAMFNHILDSFKIERLP